MTTREQERAQLLAALERFVVDVKRDPRAWSRESPGKVSANGSTGWGYSMEAALSVAMLGDPPDETDSTVKVDEATWEGLAKQAARIRSTPRAPGWRDVDAEQTAVHVLAAAAALAVRRGVAHIAAYLGRAGKRSKEPRRGYQLNIGNGTWSSLGTVADEVSRHFGKEWSDRGAWGVPQLARAFLADEAFVREACANVMAPAARKGAA